MSKTYISNCDWIVYDLHSGNVDDVTLALEAFKKKKGEDDAAIEQTLILISSLLAWDETPRNLEEIRVPGEESDTEEKKGEGEEPAEGEGEGGEGEEGEENEEGAKSEEAEEKPEEAEGEEAAAEGEGEGEEGEKAEGEEGAEGEAAEEEPVEEAPKPKKRKRYLQHPFEESDF